MIRTLRNTALSIAVVAAGIGFVPQPAVAVPSTIPLTITNNSGRPEATFVYVLGTNLTTGRLGYANANGAFTPWPAGQIPPSPAPDVSIPGPGNGQTRTIQIPKLSGRIYFSFGQRIQFLLTPTGLVQPAPWNPSDPNRNILFDWSEYTLNDSGLWINSSQVDMFSVPHSVGVRPVSGATKTTGTLVAGGRNGILNALAAQAGGWGNLIHTRPDGLRVRALAPGKGIDAGRLSPTIMDSYITRSWDYYRTRTLTVVPFQNQPSTRYFGRTSGNAMVFTNSAGQTVATFQKPSGANVFGCDGALHAPNDLVVGPIARTLCAALNRSTLASITTQPSYNPAQFYTDSVTNHYSRIIHARMADGRAYGFAFDDVGGFESLVHDGNPAQAYVTLTAF